MDLIESIRSELLAVNGTSYLQPIMHGLSSLLLLATCGSQAVLGRSSAAGPRQPRHNDILKRDVDAYIDSEYAFALHRLLCNIGSDGCAADGAAPGTVVASPSKSDPDYWYTWTRDSGLVFTAVVEAFRDDYNTTLQSEIENYFVAEAKLQGIDNPSGSLSNGEGLAEPKFNVDLTAFTGSWGRPQRDGPALRAIALVDYANWLVDNGYRSTASDVLWPAISNDLEYVTQYWNQTGFDLWEEVRGSSFFTIASQHKSLIEGSALASRLGKVSHTYEAIAPHILCFLQSFWSSSDGYILANINVNNGRSQKDANTILASIHNFDASAGCDSKTFQPCSDRALANHKAVVDSFRSIYNVNSGIPEGAAIAVGRYPEDVYYGGNPWYLNTFAAAEQLYDALYVWDAQGSISVTATSEAFFQDLIPSVSAGKTYKKGSEDYASIVDAVAAYADGFVQVASSYTPSEGHLAEQFDRHDGGPLSARDLTWSYASFLTVVARRQGKVPAAWVGSLGSQLPDDNKCLATSIVGSYASATKTSFPASQTPQDPGSAPPTTTTSEPTGCATATAVAVTFNERVETQWGQTIKMVGNTDSLGNWDPAKGVTLSARDYTSSNPLWTTTVKLQAGQTIEYKYLRVDDDSGTVTWEADPNRTYKVAASCETTAVQKDIWR